MSKQFFVWKFSGRMIDSKNPLFAAEWVCRRNDMRVLPQALPGKTIWLVMTDGGRSYLFGHVVAGKVEQAKNGDGRYILTADARASFRVLPRDRDAWREWILPRNGAAGIFAASASIAEEIRRMLAENIHAAFPRLCVAEKINVRPGGAEFEYLRVLGERFYGDLTRGRNREFTPYAALFDSAARTDTRLRETDARILHILRKGFCEPLCARSAPFVDVVLRSADESKMFARNFVAGGACDFSMDDTRKAEDAHQQIAREMCRFLRDRGLHPLCSRSIDAAVRVRNGLLIFEIKSANGKNFENQARGGIIQVLEYAMAVRRTEDNVLPVLVISSISLKDRDRETYMESFARSVEVAVVWYCRDRPLRERFFALDKLLGGRCKTE